MTVVMSVFLLTSIVQGLAPFPRVETVAGKVGRVLISASPTSVSAVTFGTSRNETHDVNFNSVYY
jgi:hypothetical protein